MERHGRVRRTGALAAFSAALVVSAFAPSLASGQNPVDDVLKGLGVGGQSPAPAAGVPGGSGYQPPLHGRNPHGQGTAASVDFFPSNTLPLGDDTSSSTDGDEGEDIVIGRSRGEQNPDGSYHGKITIFSLFGGAIVPDVEVESDPDDGPQSFNPLQQPVLDAICEGSEGQLCLIVLQADSETTNSGSTNSFNALNLNLGGDNGLHFSLLESNGNIEEDSNCQRAHGDSSVVDVNAGERQPIITVGESSADSEACNNGPSTQQNDSSFFTLGGEEPEECADGEEFSEGIPFVFAFVCNADDTNGEGENVQQAPVPYGVREALAFFLIPIIPDGGVFTRQFEPPEEETALLKFTAAASESHAVAPPRKTPPTTPVGGAGAGAPAGQVGAGPAGQDGEEGPGPVSREAGPGAGELAFTGSAVLILALIGACLLVAGLTASRHAVRHRRPAA